MVDTSEAPDAARTMEFAAPVRTTVREARACGHYCMDTVTALLEVLNEKTLPIQLREKIQGLVKGQREIARLFETALWTASREMKAKEDAMSELPLEGGDSATPQAFR